jgi:hypothetical protein
MTSRKRKTCHLPFESQSLKKGRPTKGYTIKDAVKMVSVSLQKTVPKVYKLMVMVMSV